jgi:ribose transport system substrate-binding protein
MLARCRWIVCSLTTSRSAIWRLDMPSATSESTSASRTVSPALLAAALRPPSRPTSLSASLAARSAPPQDGEALTPVAQKAEAAGIPVINLDRLFSAPDAATATILGDNYQIGVSAADYIGEELGCKGNVVEIQGLAGISVTEERTKGFADELKKVCPDGGIDIVAQQPGDFNPDTGLKVMENILQAEDQIDAVYTHDDDMAQGVVQAIRNAGRDDEMFLTGVGGSQDAMAQIKEGGLYRATFLYNPSMAASAVNMARLIALGEGFEELVPPEVPRQVVVPAATVTKENVDDYEEYAFN